jgi:ribosomal protein S18 acetylase RimI-like enzyme
MIRRATLRDLDRLTLLERSGLPAKEAYSRRQLRYLISRAQGLVLVEEEGRELWGLLTLLWRRGSAIARIYDLVVHPERRRGGVAWTLLERAKAVAASRGLHWLSVEVAAINTPACLLYQQFGFLLQERLPDYYRGGLEGLRFRKTVL